MYRLDTYATIRIGSRAESPSDYWRREVLSLRHMLPVIFFIVILVSGMSYAAGLSSLTIQVYHDKTPLHNAVVELWINNSLAYRGVTDSNGTVQAANITPGQYVIHVYYNGTVWTTTQNITLNTTTITLNITDPLASKNPNTVLATNWLFDKGTIIILVAGLVILVLLGLAAANGKFPRRR